MARQEKFVLRWWRTKGPSPAEDENSSCFFCLIEEKEEFSCIFCAREQINRLRKGTQYEIWLGSHLIEQAQTKVQPFRFTREECTHDAQLRF